jgi:hypothetical protein
MMASSGGTQGCSSRWRSSTAWGGSSRHSASAASDTRWSLSPVCSCCMSSSRSCASTRDLRGRWVGRWVGGSAAGERRWDGAAGRRVSVWVLPCRRLSPTANGWQQGTVCRQQLAGSATLRGAASAPAPSLHPHWLPAGLTLAAAAPVQLAPPAPPVPAAAAAGLSAAAAAGSASAARRCRPCGRCPAFGEQQGWVGGLGGKGKGEGGREAGAGAGASGGVAPDARSSLAEARLRRPAAAAPRGVGAWSRAWEA